MNVCTDGKVITAAELIKVYSEASHMVLDPLRGGPKLKEIVKIAKLNKGYPYRLYILVVPCVPDLRAYCAKCGLLLFLFKTNLFILSYIYILFTTSV